MKKLFIFLVLSLFIINCSNNKLDLVNNSAHYPIKLIWDDEKSVCFIYNGRYKETKFSKDNCIYAINKLMEYRKSYGYNKNNI